MRKVCSIVMALVMAFTIFVVPTWGEAAYAEDEDAAVNALDLEEPEEAVEPEDTLGALEDYVKPAAPEVTVTETESSVTFAWTVQTDTEYRFSWDGGATWEYAADSSINSQEKTGQAGESFTFTLQAYIIVPEGTPDAVEVEGDWALLSDTTSKTGTIKTPAPVYTAPAATTITSMKAGYDNISITWSTVAGVDGYAFSRGISNAYRDIGTATSFNWTGLEQRTSYTFYVWTYIVVPKGTAGSVMINPREGTNEAQKCVLLSPVASKTVKTDSSEKLTRKKKSRGYVYKYYNAEYGKGDLGTSYSMWKKVKNAKSKTKYLIAIDTKRNNVVIYKGKKGHWKVYKHVICSCGMPQHTTPHGTFKIFKRKPKFHGFIQRHGKVTKDKYTCWYATRFKGACFFHSTLYKYDSKSAHADRKLGDNRSHGCIRMYISDARWIYNNCKNGTTVISSSCPKDCSFGEWKWK